MWRAIRTKSRLDEFINEAMLTPLDVEILQTRLKGWSRVQQSQHFNMSIGGVNCRIDGAYAQLNQQAVMNATITANLGCMAQQIAQLQGLTKIVVPNTSVCPGWGNVTITPGGTTTV